MYIFSDYRKAVSSHELNIFDFIYSTLSAYDEDTDEEDMAAALLAAEAVVPAAEEEPAVVLETAVDQAVEAASDHDSEVISSCKTDESMEIEEIGKNQAWDFPVLKV